jgi:glycosyl hydrolase family 114
MKALRILLASSRPTAACWLLLLLVCCGDDAHVSPAAGQGEPPYPLPTVNGPLGSGGTPEPAPGAAGGATARMLTLPPTGGGFDYQLGGAYALPAGVAVVSRDMSDSPLPDVYSICYVNAFQTQPDADWTGARDALILRDRRGAKLRDPDWPDEYFLDISVASKRSALVDIVGGWIEECAAKGFDAVELDNLDSFTRADELLSVDETLAYARELLGIAHANMLGVAQKNTAEQSALFHEAGFDFSVAEECYAYEGDCELYTDAYGARVFDVEYSVAAFERGCRAATLPQPILRDEELVPPGPGYVRRSCSALPL